MQKPRTIFWFVIGVAILTVVFRISIAGAGIDVYRSTSDQAKRCYTWKQIPKNMTHISQPYESYPACYRTIGQEVAPLKHDSNP